MQILSSERYFAEDSPPVKVFHQIRHAVVGMHTHEFYEFVFIEQGSCLHSGTDTSGILTAGDILLFPPGTAHAYVNTNSTWLYNCLFLPSALALYSAEELASPLFTTPWRVKTDPVCRQNFVQLLERIIFEQETRESGWERMITARFTEIMVLVERCIASAPQTDSQSAHYRDLMQVMRFIEEHPHQELTLEELARVAGMSQSNLTRQFKLTTGMAPVEYCRSFRIAKAGELLKCPGATVTGVASEMGFSDISVFSRQFKQVTGMSPTEFRRNL
ncbi:MAG: helix-turn-helix domain-containing protein [Ruminococcaceae bacterium]|nr:helix-turn-helix domain-containing protein [Oscillospiraceae bacterium]